MYIEKSLRVEILSLCSHHVPRNIDLVMDMKVRSRPLPRRVSLWSSRNVPMPFVGIPDRNFAHKLLRLRNTITLTNCLFQGHACMFGETVTSCHSVIVMYNAVDQIGTVSGFYSAWTVFSYGRCGTTYRSRLLGTDGLSPIVCFESSVGN